MTSASLSSSSTSSTSSSSSGGGKFVSYDDLESAIECTLSKWVSQQSGAPGSPQFNPLPSDAPDTPHLAATLSPPRTVVQPQSSRFEKETTPAPVFTHPLLDHPGFQPESWLDENIALIAKAAKAYVKGSDPPDITKLVSNKSDEESKLLKKTQTAWCMIHKILEDPSLSAQEKMLLLTITKNRGLSIVEQRASQVFLEKSGANKEVQAVFYQGLRNNPQAEPISLLVNSMEVILKKRQLTSYSKACAFLSLLFLLTFTCRTDLFHQKTNNSSLKRSNDYSAFKQSCRCPMLH